MTQTMTLVEFAMGSELYAMDIHLVREIVPMMPITPVPRAPKHIAGIANLRGEITTLFRLSGLLGLPEREGKAKQTVIVFVPDVAGGENVGIIVDGVDSVIQVPEMAIEQIRDRSETEGGNFIKGIIKSGNGSNGSNGKPDNSGQDDVQRRKGLVIWIDMDTIIKAQVNQKGP